jgi:flagellar hook-associated protein 1 FlgK
MEALSALRSNVFTLTDGENFSESSTLDDGYNRLVSAMSGKINRARTGKSVAESQYEVALQRRDSESAVSIDEEMTSLIQFQQHYQAAARVISMASDMLNEIIGLI